MVVFMEDIIRSSREGGDEASACWFKKTALSQKEKLDGARWHLEGRNCLDFHSCRLLIIILMLVRTSLAKGQQVK